MDNKDLILLGVPEEDIAEPTIYNYPSKFNPNAFVIWDKILQLSDVENATDKWDFVIRKFVAQCRMRRIPIYHKKLDRTDNNWIIEYCRLRRKKITRFYDQMGVFTTQTRIFKLGVMREYTTMHNGFWIEATIPVRQIDLRATVELLKSYRFFPDLNAEKHSDVGYRHWHRWLIGEIGKVDLRFAASGNETAEFGYAVYVPRLPFLSLGPNEQRTRQPLLDEFVDRFVWKPLTIAHRFRNIPYGILF
jgi:hypothetical protein